MCITNPTILELNSEKTRTKTKKQKKMFLFSMRNQLPTIENHDFNEMNNQQQNEKERKKNT